VRDQISQQYKNRHNWSFVVAEMGRKNILNCQKQVLYLKETKQTEMRQRVTGKRTMVLIDKDRREYQMFSSQLSSFV
jgi:hypothetical protein